MTQNARPFWAGTGLDTPLSPVQVARRPLSWYLRASPKSQTLEMKPAAVTRAAAARGDTIGNWYAEKQRAHTLAPPDRVQLLAEARAGLIRRLYVFRLDRLARSGLRDIFEVVEELRAPGDLVPIADGFELTGPAAEVVLAVMAWAAKMERLAIDERIAAARTSLELEGRPWGPPSFARAARSRTHR